jgi:phosphatidylserine/phosphatidylglycerophosphate/cardiolipin synthase-like enzyme
MISDDTQEIFDRYRFIHAKFLLIDGQRVIISSENLSPNSLPDDDKSDGTFGRRGVVLITDAPGVVSHVQTIFDHDFDTATHVDLFRWNKSDPTYGLPDPGFIPNPATFTGQFGFELVQSPENALRDVDALLGLIGRAGSGDTIWVEQLSERPYWGESNSNASDDPNPRLEAYIAAARRGAKVRILLDEYFDSTTNAVSNENTCLYVNAIALAERLKLECALNNPTGLGIHNKMVLAHINGQGYIHVGSINGTEQSNKGNRELAIQVQSDEAYELLTSMFIRDWPHRLYLPVLYNGYIRPAEYVLIGEELYNPSGATDDSEFI